jgi:hypothetical protein
MAAGYGAEMKILGMGSGGSRHVDMVVTGERR